MHDISSQLSVGNLTSPAWIMGDGKHRRNCAKKRTKEGGLPEVICVAWRIIDSSLSIKPLSIKPIFSGLLSKSLTSEFWRFTVL